MIEKLTEAIEKYKDEPPIYAYVRGDCPDLSMCDGGRWLWEMDDSKLAQYNERKETELMNTRVKGFIYLLLSAVTWFYAIACESDLRGWKHDSGSIILRFALAIIPLYIYLKVRKVPMELSVEEGKKILCVTVFGYGITALLLYSAYDYMPSGMATVIHFGYPVFVLLGSLIFL